MAKKRESKIFFGWYSLVAVSSLCAMVQGFTSNALTVIFKPLSTQLGFSRASASGAASIARFEGGIESPVSGWLVDKFGPKWVMFAGISSIGLGLVLMNFIHSLWAYYIAWGVLVASGNNFALSIPIDKTITDWFIKKRGIAMGIKFAFIGVGGVIVVPVISWLTNTFSWRTACAVWALVAFASLLLVVFFIRQRRPEYYGLLPDGARVEAGVASAELVKKGERYASDAQELEFTLRQAMSTQAYWLILLSGAGNSMVTSSINLHIVPFLTDSGISAVAAGFMLSLMNFSTIPGRLFGGMLADRVGKKQLPYLIAASYLINAVGIAAVLVRPSIYTMYLLLVLYGIGSGASTPVSVLTRGRFFGRKAYGSISGTSSMISAPIGIVAPIYTGWVYDTSGSYVTAFAVMAVLATLSALAAGLIRPPRLASTTTDMSKFM